jgi:tetratricopeptide (TPR) repeat protein
MTSIASVVALSSSDPADPADLADEYRHAASSLAELLEPFRFQLVVVASATHVAGAFDRYRGMLLSLLERWEEAEEAFGDALRLERGAGAPPLTARTQYWYAYMLLRRGLEADRARAGDLLTACHDEAQQRGMMQLLTQAEKLKACV